MNHQVFRRALFGLLLSSCLWAPLFAQSPVAVETLEQLDRETAKLGTAIVQKLLTLGTGLRVRFGEFSFEGIDTSLGTYLSNQLAAVLVNSGGGGYTVITGPITGNAGENGYTLGGEILWMGDAIRVYVRLIRSQDLSLSAVWNTDFVLTSFLEDLLAFSPSSSDSRVRRDSYEPDSSDAPVPAAIGTWIPRTIHEGDEDWFQITAEHTGLLILETGNSSFDPVMALYDESGYNQLDEDDDGGDDSNPRIEINAEAGQVFLAVIQGYDSNEIGDYRFRASFEAAAEDTTEPNDSIEQAAPLTLGSGPVNGSLRNRDDVDFYKLEIPEPGGRLTIYTESRIDTLLSLYDSAGELLDEDDDGGDGGNARISRNVNAGTVYIKAWGYDGSRGNYSLHFEY
jgi:hypothetical protein